jgi:ferric-dicitrate binding protein FerR (iron transport regulator)
VEPAAKRPFRVRTPDATIEALGTQFDVYRDAGRETLLFLEKLDEFEVERRAGARIVRERRLPVTD